MDTGEVLLVFLVSLAKLPGTLKNPKCDHRLHFRLYDEHSPKHRHFTSSTLMTRKMSPQLSLLAVGSMLLAAPLHGQFLYVTNFLSNDVSAYTIDATTGALKPVPGSPYLAG